MANMHWEALEMGVPAPVGGVWRIKIDTGAAAPADINVLGAEPIFSGTSYRVAPRSIVVLLTKPWN
jgi:hypothetical protein